MKNIYFSAKFVETESRIIGVPLDDLRIQPTATIGECLWQIPMIKADLKLFRQVVFIINITHM